MNISTLSTPFSWARPILTKINQNKLKFSIYLLVAYLSALLVSHLLGDSLDVTKLKYKGPPSSRPTRQVAQQQQVDPFATRPRIETKNGHLILSASQDKNIDFKTSGGRGAITMNGLKLDQLFAVARALEKSTKFVADQTTNSTVKENDLNVQEQYELVLKSFLEAANKIKDLSEQQERLKANLNNQVRETEKNSKVRNRSRKQLNELRREFNSMLEKLKRNDCFDLQTGKSVCLNGAVCVDQFDSYKCICPDQFEGDRCELDVDECQRFRNTDLGCQNGAKCVNLVGSYKCECPAQFHGVHCTEQHNDCSLASSSAMCGHGKCVNLARSQANQANFECICDQGWTTDGKSAACLIDVDECLAGQMSGPSAGNVSVDQAGDGGVQQQLGVYPCSQNPFVECYNLPGSFRCGPCPPGYQGNGRVCRDIDECRRDNGGCSRSPLVECTNLPGGRKCGPCPPGYVTNDDSLTCLRVSACQRELNGGCDPMAKCVELAGVANPDAARLCVCQYPFVGQGVGPNGCTLFGLVQSSPLSPASADPFAIYGGPNSSDSSNGQSGREFYVSDYSRMMHSLGNATRVQIQTQDDCNPNPCSNGGQCLQGDGSFECVCPARWTGPNCQQPVEFGCGGLLPSASRGVFEFPLDGAYDKMFNDQKQQQASSNQMPSRTGPTSSNQPRQIQCVWQLAMPIGMAIRMAFSKMQTSRRASQIVSYVNSASNGTSSELALRSSVLFEVSHKAPPSSNCIERLDVRERLAPELQSPAESGQLLARFCVSPTNTGGANKFNGSLQLESESSLVEFEYTFAPRPEQTFVPSLTFQLQWTKIEPPCGGPLPLGDSGSVSSPQFPNFYQAGLECRYLLRVSPGKRIRIQVGELRLLRSGSGSRDQNECADSLTILDGAISVDRPILFQHCANRGDDSHHRGGSSVAAQPIISSSSTVEVVLISQPNSRQPLLAPGKHKGGFYLTYRSEPNEPNCSGLYTAKTGVIRSSDYAASSAATVADLDGGGNDDSALAHQFAHYFNLKETDGPYTEKIGNKIWRDKLYNSTKAQLRCEYEIRPADLQRNHHVQLDWIEMPSVVPSGQMASLDLWMRALRCHFSKLMIFHSKPTSAEEERNRTSDKLLATLCNGDRYNSSLSELRPLISPGHVLYLVYESFVPPERHRANWTSHGFRLSYKTVCSAVYQQLDGQIQTELGRDVPECVYHLRLPANNSIRLVVDRWHAPGPSDPFADQPALLDDQSKQQQALEQSLWMPDGSCIVQTIIMDGAVPRADLAGLAETERQLKTFEFSGPSPELATNTADSYDSAQTVPPTPGSRVGDVQSEDGSPTGPSYWQYSSSQTHDIKEVNICWLSTLGIHTAWNELSLMFRLNPKWLEQRPVPEQSEKLRQAKFVIKYQSETACGGVISEPSQGVIQLAPSQPNSSTDPNKRPRQQQQPPPPNRPCAWILRNPHANKLIRLAFERVPRDEIATRQSEWIKWLRAANVSKTVKKSNSEAKGYAKHVQDSEKPVQLRPVANCSEAFQELIELHEPSAGRVRLICPTELLMPLHWTTLSDIVQVRLINASDSLEPGASVWPGRKPLVGLNSLQLNYTMETRDRDSPVCGGMLLQTSGTIQTPRFPFNYPRKMDCVWILKAQSADQQIRLNFTRFRLEQSTGCRFDYLEIRNGPSSKSPLMNRFCGNSLESRLLISQSNVVSLHFHSDSFVTLQGFRIEFDAAQTGCGGILTAESGQIDSPNYPFPYAYGADCEWLIEVSQSNRVSLRVVDLDLSGTGSSQPNNSDCMTTGPNSDYLEILDAGDDLVGGRGKSLGRWCHLKQIMLSNRGGLFESTSNKLRVIYRSQPQDLGRGFRLTYETNCTFEHEITGPSGVIESAGFPVVRSNKYKQCTWVVRAPYGSNVSVSITHFTASRDRFHDDDLIEGDSWNGPARGKLKRNHSNIDESLCQDLSISMPSNSRLVRFWSAKVVDTPTLTITDRFRPMKPELMRQFQQAQLAMSNMTSYYNASQSIYNFTLIRALCLQRYFDERPREWRTFELDNGANVLVINQFDSATSFRVEWRSQSVCSGLTKLDSNLFMVDGIRFDERLNLTSRMASQPIECLWLLRANLDRSGSRDGLHMELELSADMRHPGELDDVRPAASVSSSGSLSLSPSQANCNQSVLQLFDGPSLSSPLLYENCATLSEHESLVASGGQVLLRYFSAGSSKASPRTSTGLAGRSFSLSGYFGHRSGCWQHKYNVRVPFRQLAGQQTSPNYPDLYEAKRYRCTYLVDSVFNLGRIRFTIDELDLPPELNSDPDSSDAMAGGGFIEPDKCRKSGNYLAFREPATTSWSAPDSYYCGRFERNAGVTAGDSTRRGVYISEGHGAELEFQSKGNSRGRWKVSYDRLCGSNMVVMNKADELATPNYPQRPQWPKSSGPTANSDISEDVCIWRVNPPSWSKSGGGERKLHFNLLNLIGTLDDEDEGFTYGSRRKLNKPTTIRTIATSGQRDCLRVYEGYNISLRQSAFNLTQMDTELEPRLRICSRADLKFNSMRYTSQGSELVIVTSGQLIAKFLVHPFENHCGGDFVLGSAEFASPNYPQPYGPDLDCHYFISGSPGSRVQLNFELFDLADSSEGNECDLAPDYVEIRQLSSRLRAETRLRDLLEWQFSANQSDVTHFDVVDYVSKRVGGNKKATDANQMARRKSLDRLLELAHLYGIFHEAGSEARTSSQVFGSNGRLSISLEEFYKKSTLIGRFCGKQLPKLAPGQLQDEILIRLRTSGRRPAGELLAADRASKQPRGFMASYELEFGGLIKLAATREDFWGFVSSPFYPERKQFNSTVVWSFEAPLNSRIEFELVSMSLGSTHRDCQDTVSIFDGLKPSGGSARLGRLCGHLSYKNLLGKSMTSLWAAALAGQVSPRKVPANSAFDPYVQANLLRRFRTSSNVATVVYENLQGPGAFLMRYKVTTASDEKTAIAKGSNSTNSTSELELELLEQPVDLNEALEEQLQPMAGQEDDRQLEADKACSRLYKLTPERTTRPTGNSTLPDTVQLKSPNWPQEIKARDLECHWLLTTDENTNIVLQIAPPRGSVTTDNSGLPTSRGRFASSEHCLKTARRRGQERNFVVVYDGASQLAPIIARLCLPAAPIQLESTSRQMLVRYVHEAPSLAQSKSSAAVASSADYSDDNSDDDDSDQQALGSGSSSLFRAQAHVGRCGGQYHVNYVAQFADRPGSRSFGSGGVSNYENNLDCFYYVFASDTERSLSISGYLSELDLASKPTNSNCTVGDFIEVRDLPISSQHFDYSPQAIELGRSLGRFCAGRPLPERLVSPGSAMVIRFHTDAQETAKGFNLAINVARSDLVAGCPQQPIKLHDVESFAKIVSPNWPHGSPGPVKTCRYSFEAPLDKSLKLTFVQLNRPSSLASNGSLVCQDSLHYLDDQEARSLRYSHRPLRELITAISATKLRQLVQSVPCSENSNKAAAAQQTSADSSNQGKQTSLVEKLTAETYKELLLQMLQEDGTLRSQLVRIVTNSSDLLLEYSAGSLLPGQGFVAVIRVDDRPAKRVCGGEVSSKLGENLLESANFGQPMDESEAHIQCAWQLKYTPPSAQQLSGGGGDGEQFLSSFLLFSVLEIPPLVQNTSIMEVVYGNYADSKWSESCGLNRLLVTDSDSRIFRAVAACGFATNSNPSWLILNKMNQENQVLLRTRNIQQVVYGRWQDKDTTGGGRIEARTKLFRGMRAYFYETPCQAHQKTAGISIVVRSHAGLASSPPTSYQPGICEWTFTLKMGHFELMFKHLNLRPSSKAVTNSSRSMGVVESKTESICFDSGDDRRSSSDYVELALSSDPDGAILARFCAQNQLEAQKHSLVINATTELTVRFIAGLEQLADGKYKFPDDKAPTLSHAEQKPFGFEFEILRVKNSTISEFCRHEARSGSIYNMIRNRERAALYLPFRSDTITPGFLYPKNSHCSLDLSIENNYRFNFTFVSFFDIEPSLFCTHDYIEIYNLVQRGELGTETTTTRRPRTTARRTKARTTTARPTSSATPSSSQDATTLKSKSSINVYEKMTLNLNDNLEPELIGRWCGRSLPKGAFVSRSNRVRVVFHSNEHVEGKGFLLEWSAIPTNDQSMDSNDDEWD